MMPSGMLRNPLLVRWLAYLRVQQSLTTVETAFAAMVRQHIQGLIVLFDRLFITQLRAIAELGVQHRMPRIHYTSEFGERGGLMAYGAELS